VIAARLAGPTVAGDAMPRRVGACATTVIPAIGRRFGAPLMRPKSKATDDGTGVELGNGVEACPTSSSRRSRTRRSAIL
jgi:hypothetical protein